MRILLHILLSSLALPRRGRLAYWHRGMHSAVVHLCFAFLCPGYLKHALSSSEIHLAAAKSLEIIGHVTNLQKAY